MKREVKSREGRIAVFLLLIAKRLKIADNPDERIILHNARMRIMHGELPKSIEENENRTLTITWNE